MSLMIGTGPFGHAPGGAFNFPRPDGVRAIYLEASPRRVRAIAAGETVADTRRARLLHEFGRVPVYCFPSEDVRPDVVTPSGRRAEAPGKGVAEWLTVAAGGQVREDAGWRWVEADPSLPGLEGLVTLIWARMDRWLEEDEEVVVHVRDPYHRVDARRSDRHVVVRLAGEVVADTTDAVAVFETGAPTRWYLPAEDVRMDLLRPMDLRTRCAYKGQARYWSVRAGGRDHEAVVWSYAEPSPELASIAGRLCFFAEQAGHELDGAAVPAPRSPWSSPDWWRGAHEPPGASTP
jgi:uncharacterized protein (DUF427 family)